jgi:hypothetical protein
MRLQWGDIPSGIGAILTGISLLIAALTYRRSVRNKEMAQAELVTSWINSDEQHNATIVIHNGGKLPIYMLEAYLDDEERLRRFYFGLLLPDSIGEVKTNIWLESAVPPDKIKFTDAAGRSWTRTDDGRLRQDKYYGRYGIPDNARGPIKLIKYVLPGRFEEPPPSGIDDRVRARAVEMAVLRGHSEKRAKSAIAKFLSRQRLNVFEKNALESAMLSVPELRNE